MDKKTNNDLRSELERERRQALRDQFAGQALIGLLAGGMVKSKVADAAYALADSMLVAREAKHAAQ